LIECKQNASCSHLQAGGAIAGARVMELYQPILAIAQIGAFATNTGVYVNNVGATGRR
jgi:hypothetical protein